MNKDKKVLFTKEIDERINGFAIVLALGTIGLFLQFAPNYFGNIIITGIIKIVLAVIAGLGLAVELGKVNNKNKFIGLDNVVFGISFIGLWIVLHIGIKHWISNSIAFLLLIVGAYSFFLGLQQIAYSLSLRKKKKSKELDPIESAQKKENQKADTLLFITKLLGVILVLFQIGKAILDITK